MNILSVITIKDENPEANAILRDCIKECFEAMRPKLQRVFYLKVKGYTDDEIAKRFNLTKSHINQLYKRAIITMRLYCQRYMQQ